MSVHEDVFRLSFNPSDANRSGGRKIDDPAPETSYLLLGAPDENYPDGLMFGSVNVGKRYVSYHLMGVAMAPELLEGMSPELRARMQGKTCFNFTKIDQALFDELSTITARGRDLYADKGWLAT